MNTFRLVAIWGMLAGVAVTARQTVWDYAAGLGTMLAMLPLAIATGETKMKRVTIPIRCNGRGRCNR